MRNPWVGLRPFQTAERFLFFGRDKEVQILKNMILTLPVLIIYGPSGTGKSSLINAGLLPDLNQDDHIVITIGSHDDINAQTRAILSSSGWTAPEGLNLADLLHQHWLDRDRRAVIFLDQFEERFNANEILDEFYSNVAKLAHSTSDAACVVLSLREDYLGNLEPLMRRIPGLMNSSYRVPSLSRRALESAVRGPLQEVGEGVTVDDRLVQRVLDDLEQHATQTQEPGEQRFEPGYFQIIWSTLWDDRMASGHRRLELKDYKRLGGAAQILKDFTASILGALEPALADMFWAILRYLVLPTGAKVALTVQDLTSLLQPTDHLVSSEISLEERSWLATLSKERSATVIQRVFSKLTSSRSPLFQRAVRSDREEFELLHDLLGTILLDWREEYRRDVAQKTRERRKTLARGARTYAAKIDKQLRSSSNPEVTFDAESKRVIREIADISRSLQAHVKNLDNSNARGLMRLAEEIERVNVEGGWLTDYSYAGPRSATALASDDLLEPGKETPSSDYATGMQEEYLRTTMRDLGLSDNDTYRISSRINSAKQGIGWGLSIIALDHSNESVRVRFQELLLTWDSGFSKPLVGAFGKPGEMAAKIAAAIVLGFGSMMVGSLIMKPFTDELGISYLRVTLTLLCLGLILLYFIAIVDAGGKLFNAVLEAAVPATVSDWRSKSSPEKILKIAATWPLPALLVQVLATLGAALAVWIGTAPAVGYNIATLFASIGAAIVYFVAVEF